MKTSEDGSATADRCTAAGIGSTEAIRSKQEMRQRHASLAVRPGYIRKADAAKYLGVSIRTLTEWMRNRIVPYYKLSHRVCLFKQADLDAAMDRFKTEAIGM